MSTILADKGTHHQLLMIENSDFPLTGTLDRITFQLEQLGDSVKMLERVQIDLAKATGCGVGHPNRLGAGAYQEEVVTAVARHWKRHVLQEAQFLGISRLEAVTEAQLPDDGDSRNPEAAASIIDTITAILSHVFTDTSLEEESSIRAQRTIRVYGRLRSVAHEALFAMAAITGDPTLCNLRLSVALETLVLALSRAVDQSGIPELQVQRGMAMFPDQPALLNTRLPTVLDKHASLIPDLPPLPSAALHAPPSCDVYICRAHDGAMWRDHFREMSPIFSLHQIPFISDEPFPLLDNFPPLLDDIKAEPEGPIPLPSLLAISSIISFIARTFISLSVRDPITRKVDPMPLTPTFRLESGMYWYSQIRDGACRAIDQLVSPEIAHANRELFPVLQRMADYQRRALEWVANTAKEESYYQLADRVPVLPGSINADAWMPKLSFHMKLPLEYPNLTPIKEEDLEWNMLPSVEDIDDLLLSAPSSSDDEKA